MDAPADAAGPAIERPVFDDVSLALPDFLIESFAEFQATDSLTVMAKGLCLDHIVVNFLKLYCDPKTLVLVINASKAQEEFYRDQLELVLGKEGHRPQYITSEMDAIERNQIYCSGGVLFVTSRILVMDLLLEKIPIELITGILVLNGHRVSPMSTEAFILRLFRLKNRSGFIKSVSEAPEVLSQGFNTTEKIMKSLWVRKLFLWPRFHLTFNAALSKNSADVVELAVRMTPAMEGIQHAMAQLIRASLRELKRAMPKLDMEHLTAEVALLKEFDHILDRQLSSQWHVLSKTVKQLVKDIRTLRKLINILYNDDAVSFYHYLQILKNSSGAFNEDSQFLFLDATDDLFSNAKRRVFGPPKKMPAIANPGSAASDTAKSSGENEIQIESHPKWNAIHAILKEIAASDVPGMTLICASDKKVCQQIERFLRYGAQVVLQRQKRWLERSQQRSAKLSSGNGVFASKVQEGAPTRARSAKARRAARKGKGRVDLPASETSRSTTSSNTDAGENDGWNSDDNDWFESVNLDDVPHEDLDKHFGEIDPDSVVMYPWQSESGTSAGSNFNAVLHDLQPRYVIVADVNQTIVRQLEMYQYCRSSKIRIYMVFFRDSIQEQRFLTAARREREAFEALIHTKQMMAVPEDQDGRKGFRQEIERCAHKEIDAAASTSRSKKRKIESVIEPEVVVDMREFRSSLPSMIHARGMKVTPRTLEIGDYVLSPDICVERKSVEDLIGSLKSGRLLKQATEMTRYYNNAVLLIEFDEERPFSLLGSHEILTDEVEFKNTMSKLTLLTITFPQLRFLWCRTPQLTAEAFATLKLHCLEPDADAAAALSSETQSEKPSNTLFAHAPQDFLAKLPGISPKNIRHVMNKVADLKTLSEMALSELEELIGKASGKQLYDFFRNRGSA